ncbi:MAG: ABC transporter ATP-binding protein [Candidatus Omnitrophica bacterium]|nr:ABC transporter ATP-binding protein [Candidatus Omnitrophota bacterium]
MLALRDLSVCYGAVEALRGVSLTVGPGEIVALLGANGAGKTTTLMAISGVAPVARGTIQFQAQAIQGWPSEQIVAAGVTQVPEGRRVFPRLTVEDNLRLGGYRHPAAAQAETLAQVWALFPILQARRRQLAGTLSGGEQQLLALGRGLMARPRLLALDEPSLGLAPKAVAHLFQAIRQINAAGLPVLLVEQNAYQALRIAHRGYVLAGGRIVLEGPTAALLHDPAIRHAYLGGGG